jgi:putative ABC transport system permease protein
VRITGLAWLLGWRDIRWRWRRFVIAAAGISLAFALTLLLSGFRDGIDLETDQTLRQIGADGFVVKDGVHGPFTTTAQLPADLADDVAELPGVDRADPMVSVRHTIASEPEVDVYVIGARPGGLGAPHPSSGRAPARRGEAVLDGRGEREIGDRFMLGGISFEVVGLVRNTSVWGGVADLFVTLRDAQDLLLDGEDGATAILTRGLPEQSLPGTRVLDLDEARADLKRPVQNAITTIDVFRMLVWLVAAAIIGSLLYVSALERNRDFAVCKAFGSAGVDLVGALMLEAVVLAAVSAGLGLGLSRVLLFLFPSIISFPARTLVLLPLVALAVGVIGSVAGARRALSVDPATAFGGP